MSEESDLVANIIANDINTLVEDLNNVIKAHNVLVDENQQLKDRINKACEHISNEFLCYDNESDEYIQGLKTIDLLKGDKE